MSKKAPAQKQESEKFVRWLRGSRPTEQTTIADQAHAKSGHGVNFAASFHKLFTHDEDTGLLTPDGVTSYKNYLDGLNNPPNTPNSNFDQDALNAITLANPGPDVPPRVLINPQSSKSLTIKGGDIAAFRFKSQPITGQAWQLGYGVVYAQGEANANALLRELSFSSGYSAAEMMEVYAMAVLRDLKFVDYHA